MAREMVSEGDSRWRRLTIALVQFTSARVHEDDDLFHDFGIGAFDANDEFIFVVGRFEQVARGRVQSIEALGDDG